MRVVFLGTPETAVPSLDAVRQAGHEVVLAVTQPDRPSGRSRVPLPSAVKVRAGQLGIPLLQPERVRTDGFRAAIVAARPEALVVVAFGRILPRSVLDVAGHGAVNVHFSLLPRYRGAAPVQWALARGESETGVTTFRLDEGLDTGEILVQRPAAIDPGEHAPALLARLAVIGGEVLAETLDGLAAGRIVPRPQDASAATKAPILTREDGAFDPAWAAAELAGRVRGFDPWPGVWARCGAARLRIVEACVAEGRAPDAEPGTILEGEGDAVRLVCADGTVASVIAVQPEGARAMTARAAVNGRRLAVGGYLGRPEPAA